MKTKIFCDSADLKTIKKFNNNFLVSGFTTNPSLMRIAGAKNCGCSIITMPPSIIEKISKFGKTYQELTLDTVRKFLKDSSDSNFKI